MNPLIRSLCALLLIGVQVHAAGYDLLLNQKGPSDVVTITIATPGVVSWTDHPFKTGDPVSFTTTGALPTGITSGTRYFARSITSNTIHLYTSQTGAINATTSVRVNTSGSQSGVHTGYDGKVLTVTLAKPASTSVVSMNGSGTLSFTSLASLGDITIGSTTIPLGGTATSLADITACSMGSLTIQSGSGGVFLYNGTGSPTIVTAGALNFDNDAWAASRGTIVLHDGTATVSVLAALSSDSPSNGQVPVWNTGGTITWEAIQGVAEAYDASGWDGDQSAAAKNDVRDKIETITSGQLLQRAVVTYATAASSTSVIPFDGTIPQQGGSEGTEVISTSFTPESATSKIHLRLTMPVSGSTFIAVAGALFINSTADCLAASFTTVAAAGAASLIVVEATLDSPGTSAQTFKVRYGPSGSTAYINSLNGSGNTFGGKVLTTLTIEEVSN